jgi:ketosteroid isomerase-like protein
MAFGKNGIKNMTGTTSRQRVLHLLDTYYAGDIEAALAGCADDLEYFAPAPIDILPHMGQHHGKDSVRKAWQTIRARYSDMRHEVRTIVAENDTVAAHVRVFLTKRTNGRVIQFDSAMFFRLHENRIASIHQIIDTFDLVQQVLERDLGALLTGDTQA